MQKKREFFALANFPDVIGAVDCSHIRLYGAPLGDNEHLFVNRKGFHSINAQVICDAKFNIINVVARWPGSMHDSAIFHGSRISDRFENGRFHGVLIGDTGYALRPWLMTPVQYPATNAERRYNRSHRRTRVVIEQTFGQLKRRFPCLSLGMRVSPERACFIIKACCVLFNISKSLREPEFDGDLDEDADDNYEDEGIQYNGPLHDGTVKRNELINRYF
ncbi:putative nuclease HARBI1 [Asterias rubens]|uniref:putative nuclease HARBI1 n=1 Tax=Asterias rubens TaxID=7604 RepID=UPI001455D496|nr:putative nuclease HARBI1 [Asterias rubens]